MNFGTFTNFPVTNTQITNTPVTKIKDSANKSPSPKWLGFSASKFLSYNCRCKPRRNQTLEQNAIGDEN